MFKEYKQKSEKEIKNNRKLESIQSYNENQNELLIV